MKRFIILALAAATTSHAAFDLQEAIDNAGSGSVITVPKGTYSYPISIKKGITLKGTGAILEVVSNKPAILIDSQKEVVIDGFTVKWKMESKAEKGDTPYAIFLRNGKLLLQNCSFTASGSGDEAPGAVSAQDKSELEIQSCRFEGFEYTIQFWNGAEGKITDCLVMNPGHCGITIGNGSKGELERNIVTGSRYHGIRCTGGEIIAKSNLIVRNKNRGFYIGNKSAIGELSNNLIVENSTGINVYANSKLEIVNNVIVRSSFAGLSIADTAKLKIESNVIAENEKGAVGFSSDNAQDVSVDISRKNLFFGNTVESEFIDLTSKTLRVDPEFKNPEAGLYATSAKSIGLQNPEELMALWTKWQAALDAR